MSQKKVAIGIDLGTTKCCVGVLRDGKVEILENERSRKTTPSYVAFTDTERLVGEDAKDQATLNPTNTVFGVKGIIGRGLEDDQAKKATIERPYIIFDNSGHPCINVTYKGEEEALLPQQVTSMLLTKMKKLAEDRLGCSVEEAVISVPASFSNAQRQATKEAATIAGLKVLALINEPTAAAIAYQANRKKEAKETIAVVDFGGGKLDVGIASVRNTRVAIKGMSGTMDLGGNAVDEILMLYVLDKFRAKFSQDPPKAVSVMERLRAACVKFKHSLSLLPKVQNQLDCFGEEFLLPISMSREKYDDMISDKISTCLSTHFARALHVSGLEKQNISRVVLVGGSTRIPLVSEKIQSFFDGTKLDRSVNPDEAVAHGAAIYAALLSGENSVTELAVYDILPNSFCMGVENSEYVQEVFPASQIPSSRIHMFSDNEIKLKQTFYEILAGRKDPHKLLGTLSLSQEFARAVSLVDKVCFEINNCGVFDVHVHLKPNHIFHAVLHNNTARLSDSKLREAVERENRFRNDDKDEGDRIAALTDLESKCFGLQNAMQTSKGKTYFPELVEEIVLLATETIDWMDTTAMVTRSECLKRNKYLTKLERSLRDNINETDRIEKERATAENNLRLYCSQLEEEVKNNDAREEAELVAEICELVKQNKEWLQANEVPSTTDCDTKTAVLEQIHLELKNRVEEKLQERARLAAVEELQSFCATLLKDLTGKQGCMQDLSLVYKLIDEAKAVEKWLYSDSGHSKADCEAKKMELGKMLEIQKREENREAEEQERIRAAAVKSLRTYCHDLRERVKNCRVIKSDAPPAAQLVTELIATILWLQDGKTASLSQCGEKANIIRSLLTAFDEAVEKEEQITFKKREDERKSALTNFQIRHSHVESSLLTEAVKKQHSGLVNEMVRLVQETTKWLETSDTFSRQEYESRLERLDRIRVTQSGLLDEERKKQLLVDAQQDISSEGPASPVDTEGEVPNTEVNDERSGAPKRLSKNEKNQSKQTCLQLTLAEKSGDGDNVENEGGSLEQDGARGSGAEDNNHSDSKNGKNILSNFNECKEEKNKPPTRAAKRAAEEEKPKQDNKTDQTEEEAPGKRNETVEGEGK